jgi:hypothetical protein
MVRIAFAVFMGATLFAGVVQAACTVNPTTTKTQQAKKHPAAADNCLNLTAVPQISAGVVAAEPAPAAKAPTYVAPTDSPYEGPTLGMSKPDPGVKPIPTVGYHWSLE